MDLTVSEIGKFFFDKNPVPMVVFDLDTLVILKANKAAVKRYGYLVKEFEEMDLKDLHSREEIPILLKHLGGIDKNLQNPYFRHQKKNGDVFYAQVSSRNFTWQEKEVQLAVIHDVTKQVEAQERTEAAEKKAREERKFASLLINNLPDAFWLMDKEGNVVQWNENLENVSGFSGEEIKNRFILDFFAEEEHSGLRKALAEAFSEGKATSEGTLITKNGSSIPHALTGIKFTDNDELYIAGIGVNIKAQKDYQKKVEEAKAKLHRAQKIARIGSWELDMKSMELNWSEEVYHLFGLSKEAFNPTWEKLLDQVPQKDQDHLQQALSGLLEEGGSADVEHRIITTSGEIRDVVERGEVDYNDKGSPVRVSGTIQDITERKEVEKRLEESQKNLERAQQIANIGSFEWDVVNNEIEYSKEAYTIYGIERNNDQNPEIELFLDVVHPADRAFVNEQIEQILNGNGVEEFEHRLLTKNGNEKHVIQRVDFVADEGSVIKIFGTVQDITERKKNEDAIKEEKLRFQLATKSVSDVIWDWDFSENRIWWSEGLRTVFGYNDYKAASDPDWWEKQIHFEDRERAEESINSFLASNKRYWAICYKFCNADGSISYVEENGYAIRDEQGIPIRMIGAMSDITERKESELRIQKSLEEKEVLLAEVHHRVKNNLAIISGLLDLQLMSAQNDHAHHLLRDSRSRIFSMAKVHEMLYKSGDFTNVSFKQYIVEIIDHISDLLKTGNIKFHFKSAIENLYLDVNQAIPSALIINEVLNNAVEYAFTGKKAGNISISLREIGEQVAIEINDDGVGIPKSILNGSQSSTSLGLTLVDTLTEQVSGTSQYSINDKGGTKFELKFKPQKKKGSANTYF